MDRKELFMNVRKAYRLAYEVQDSIVGTVEYIRDRIRYTACAGSQLFSDPIEKYKSAIDGEADQKFGKDSWGKKGSWKYLPTYMYMYYFQCKPTETQNCCFAIVQVMDDGFAELPETNASPSTEFFKSPRIPSHTSCSPSQSGKTKITSGSIAMRRKPFYPIWKPKS